MQALYQAATHVDLSPQYSAPSQRCQVTLQLPCGSSDVSGDPYVCGSDIASFRSREELPDPLQPLYLEEHIASMHSNPGL
jgi:hypothetical protein